jgi:hypothetical protein
VLITQGLGSERAGCIAQIVYFALDQRFESLKLGVTGGRPLP